MRTSLLNEHTGAKPDYKRLVACALACLTTGGLLLLVSRQPSTSMPGGRPVELSSSILPLYRISASSPFDAGLQHGLLARDRIHGWFATPEMQSIFRWVQDSGSVAFERLKDDNAREFPSYVEEMQGIAEGAGVTLDQVWCANMINELENLMDIAGTPAEHCSDVYAIDGSYAAGFAHGHNDDWSETAKAFWYLTALSYRDATPGFEHCAGMTYPATLVGWAPTWNQHGIFATQNSLLPRKSRGSGLACAFVQRRAFCSSKTLDDVIEALAAPGWSDGASLNIVDLVGKRMANVELWEDRHSVVEVLEGMGNYSHFNEYKHLRTASGEAIDDTRLFATDRRQETVDSLPAARTDRDVMERLSNPRVFRPQATLATTILNGSTGRLSIWVASPSASTSPVYSWDMLKFFDAATHV